MNETDVLVKSWKKDREIENVFPNVEEALAFCYHMIDVNLCTPTSMHRNGEQLYDRHGILSEVIAQRRTLARVYLDQLEKQREIEENVTGQTGDGI